MIFEAIKRIYPDIQSYQFILQDDGNGPYIKAWSYPSPQPSQSQIDDAIPAVLKAAAHARINGAYEVAIRVITSGYPQNEIDSWPKQETEARTWMANNSAATPWIDAAAAVRGISKADLVGRIIAKADVFAIIHGELTGKRQKLEDQIEALGASPTQQQLDAIQW